MDTLVVTVNGNKLAATPIRRDEISSTVTELVARLRPGVDGLILAWDGHRGTFLPQVWEQLPDPQQFLNRLKQKAGLPVSFWSPQVTVRRYSVTAWTEPADRPMEVIR